MIVMGSDFIDIDYYEWTAYDEFSLNSIMAMRKALSAKRMVFC